MLTTTELITLKGVKYSDTSSIVHTFSESLGSLSFKISRTPSSRRRGGMGAFFMPLSILSVTIDYQTKREIFIPREISLIHAPLAPSIDPIANAITLFTTELLNRLLRSSGSDKELYRFLKEQIIKIDTLPNHELSSFHLVVIVGLLHYLGILPQAESFRAGYILDYSEGHFRPTYNSEEQLLAEPSQWLHTFITTSNPASIPMNREQRNALLELLLRHLTYHFPEVGTLRSPSILSQLFI